MADKYEPLYLRLIHFPYRPQARKHAWGLFHLLGRDISAIIHGCDPLRQQYLRIKRQFPDTIVFFRLGDFYESFDDDAKKVAAACNIVLTAREMGTGNRVPLAGVPYHAVETYLAKLIQAGHKVAIVEQTGTPQSVRGVRGRVLETREVARIVRPPQVTSCPRGGQGRYA